DIKTEATSEELRAIKVDPIPERIGQRLEIALRNSLNPVGEPTPTPYRLNTVLAVVLSNLGIQSQGLATLGPIDAIATFRLIDLQTGSILLTNTVHVENSFDLNPNQYSTIVGEDDAGVRSVAELDQEIVARLTLFMQRRTAEKSAKPASDAVKLPPARVARFRGRPDRARRAVLLYGPDTGLVRERADILARTVCPDLKDPFRVTDLNGSGLVADPARLADEAAQMSLIGGRRVIR